MQAQTELHSSNAGGDKHGHLAGKYLTFALGDERYGVDILKVQEIIGVTNITHVPRTDGYLKGVINLRGKIIPIIDLRLKLDMSPVPYDHKTCFIVMKVLIKEQEICVGVVVDTVLEVCNLDAKNIQDAPDYGDSIDTKFILGMARQQEHVIILVDIDRTLGSADAEALLASSE